MVLRTLILATMIFLLVLALSGPACAQYAVGDHVADFTLPNQNNQQVALYDYHDRIVVLPFWFYG
jgi:cytochrome oxidase Cu insertion factor (SCO1/SenC/PrrC family)